MIFFQFEFKFFFLDFLDFFLIEFEFYVLRFKKVCVYELNLWYLKKKERNELKIQRRLILISIFSNWNFKLIDVKEKNIYIKIMHILKLWNFI